MRTTTEIRRDLIRVDSLPFQERLPAARRLLAGARGLYVEKIKELGVLVKNSREVENLFAEAIHRLAPSQERRLILAAIDYVRADRAYVKMRKAHITAKRIVGEFSCEEERQKRCLASLERARTKARLLRAAGVFRKQRLLPIEKARGG